MSRSALVIAVGLFAGIAVAAFVFTGQKSETSSSASADMYFDQSAAIDDRIRALEAAVAEERNARQLLEEELLVLYEAIDDLDEQAAERGERQADNVPANRERFAEIRQLRGNRSNEDLVTRLVNTGFSPDRAEWIQQRESELQMAAMQARFDARRAGEPADPFNPAMNSNAALRAEIGDLEYEQYLEASNRPTSVPIGSVLESSPGQAAGLQRGDEIVRYGGARVFDVNDLNQQTMVGQAGESVIVDIVRDGVPMQVVLPRGPIGVTTGRFPGRR